MEDRQRKLHQVLYNYYSSHRAMPTWNVLVRSTGKSKDQLQQVLDDMQAAGVLNWINVDPATIKLLQMPGQPGQSIQQRIDGQRYFTDY